MSKLHLQQSIEAILEGNLDKATAMLKRSLEIRLSNMVKEDHEKSMSEEELKHYIKDLHSKAKDEHKEAFAKHLEAGECNDEAFDKAAAKHCTSKDKADGLIHKLEKLVGSKIDPKEYKQDKKKGESDSKAEKESKMKKGQVKEAKHPNEVDNLHGRAPPCAKCGHHRDANIHLKQYDYEDYHKYEEPKKVKESDEIKQDILNELKASTLGNYVRKATDKASRYNWANGYFDGKDNAGETLSDESRELRTTSGRKAMKREAGIKKASDKLVKKASK